MSPLRFRAGHHRRHSRSAASLSAKLPAYTEESIVIEHTDSIYTYAPDGTGTHERTVAVRVQSEAAVHSLGIVAVPYAANSQRVDFLSARVRHPDGSVTETPSSDPSTCPMPSPARRLSTAT
jgi:hypothetical protein